MKVELHNTSKIVELDVGGATVPARIWEGITENGVRCHAYITRIAAHKDQDLSLFEAELQAEAPPSAEIQAIPFRLIL